MNVPKLRFKGFSDDWIKKKIGEITLKVGSGSTPRGGEKVYQSNGIPFIRSQNVNNNFLNLKDLTFIPDAIHKQMQGSTVKANDILLNITGASIGRSCVVPDNFKEGNVNQHVCIIRLKSGFLSRFIQPFLSSTRGQKLVLSHQVGSGREGLNFQAVRSFSIDIPSFPEQTKIANFLTAIDEKITQLTQKNDLLKQYKKGVMQQIFSQKLRFKDDDGREFPEWETKQLGSLVKVYDGTHMTPKYQNQGIPFYSVEHVTNNNFKETRFISREVFEKENKRVKLEKGDILMTRIGDIGTPKYINWEVEASFYVSLALLKQSKKINSLYLSHYIGSDSFQGELHKRTIHVAFPKKINLGEISHCLVSYPCITEQIKIANFLTAIDDKITQTQAQLEAVKHYKNSLLQQMFV
ncbi:restriction endonuclease subunit S [Nitrosomonas marina]|nr:restriction endonuclease subunit S [Nitrosomonas marina]